MYYEYRISSFGLFYLFVLILGGLFISFLPADVMRNMGAHKIITVDVGSENTAEMTNYGDQLSGWWLLWNRWNPFAVTVNVSED